MESAHLVKSAFFKNVQKHRVPQQPLLVSELTLTAKDTAVVAANVVAEVTQGFEDAISPVTNIVGAQAPSVNLQNMTVFQSLILGGIGMIVGRSAR